MNRLLIMACSQTKSKDPSTRLSARERYTGPLWLTLKNTDPQGHLAKVAFLSALEGFRDAIWPVDQYDKRMTPDLAATMIAGGIGMPWPIMKPGVAGGMTAASHMSSMTAWCKKPFDDVCMVGGHLYLDVMRAYMQQFVSGGYVTADATITEINGQIGYMRRDLKAWLLQPLNADMAA
ncbi:hypothetical protein G6L37_04510 [Agrobacterium rubi]|nr:hypothetical protein [Agrobacterium rubi]NTF24615.1 hypothetical protein [Agrobacterium rubi]